MSQIIWASQTIGHIFVAAAGNCPNRCPRDNDLYPIHPASHFCPNIIAVAATDNDDDLAWFSHYGRTSVDLAAPGENVYSTVLASNYGFKSGTSMAAPHVTGAVALVRTRMPNLTWQEVKQRILDTVRTPIPDPNPLAGKTVSEGVLNAFDALLDCNSNGVDDAQDVSSGTSLDCNANSFPDECELDCNENDVPDECDITTGTSLDCNVNGIPDECEPFRDCNGNGTPDFCDIASGASENCNGDQMPDECEPDCNMNAIADECDIAGGTSADCNGNGVPDECEPPGPGGDPPPYELDYGFDLSEEEEDDSEEADD